MIPIYNYLFGLGQTEYIVKLVDYLKKNFSFVLEDEEKNFIAELYVADDDTVILGGDLMEGLDQDLDNFLTDLLED